jgi:ABC-type sugar transport system substrate-binding protein
MAELASHMDIGAIMLHNDGMTLGQVLSLLPHTDELPRALEAALTALGRQGVEGRGSE